MSPRNLRSRETGPRRALVVKKRIVFFFSERNNHSDFDRP